MVDGFVVSNFLGNRFNYAPKWGVVGPGEVAQFDIVYGPYSSRYVGNSMGGIVNITTRDPTDREVFATVQGFAERYRQFATRDDYFGGSAEAGFGLKQKDGPFSVRMTGRYFRNDGHPMSFYGLKQTSGGKRGSYRDGPSCASLWAQSRSPRAHAMTIGVHSMAVWRGSALGLSQAGRSRIATPRAPTMR
jgi:outer membrane receptor protein involved in Fe transport